MSEGDETTEATAAEDGENGAGAAKEPSSFQEFLETVGAAATAGRRALMQRTIEQHAPRARSRVAALREQHPELTSEAVAEKLTREAASQAAVVGAAVAVPGLVPGLGTAVSVALAGPEVPWLFREQIKLSLDIATVYGRDPGDLDARLPELEGLFGSALTAVQIGNTGTQLFLSMMATAGRGHAGRLLGTAIRIAATAAGLAVRRGGLFRKVPLLGLPIGAVTNALALVSAGTEARQRYGQVAVSIYEGVTATVEEEPDTVEPPPAAEPSNPFEGGEGPAGGEEAV